MREKSKEEGTARGHTDSTELLCGVPQSVCFDCILYFNNTYKYKNIQQHGGRMRMK